LTDAAADPGDIVPVSVCRHGDGGYLRHSIAEAAMLKDQFTGISLVLGQSPFDVMETSGIRARPFGGIVMGLGTSKSTISANSAFIESSLSAELPCWQPSGLFRLHRR
jgi:hypothetical protein